MVSLVPESLRWMESDDEARDLCLHGKVRFQVDDELLVDPATSIDVTVSAAGLYLLRTLTREHTHSEPVGDHLFPCCGFAIEGSPETEDVLLLGCPSGLTFEVLHDTTGRAITLRNAAGLDWRVSAEDWREAVFAFADAVSSHYAASPPRQPNPEDATGYRAFLAEWSRRRGAAFSR